jgi:Helix-turn-helix domain
MAVTEQHCNLYSGIMATEPGKEVMDIVRTISVPEAGRRYFDLGKNGSYAAAKRGEIPVIKIGSRLRVPVSKLDRMLEEAGERKSTAA